MSKYTKGPWKVIHRDDGLIEAWQVVGPGADEWVADCGIGGNSEDCARLIAAAPEMLDAMKEFVRRCEAGEVRSRRTYAQFVELIAKAEGR